MAGQAVILKGTNGAGKTTLLKTLAGLHPLAAGKITSAGRSIFIGHENGLNPIFTVEECLQFYARLWGARYCPEVLSVFGLAAYRYWPVVKLSQGFQRKVALSRLSLGAEKLWLLDEPTAHLDTVGESVFMKLLQSHLKDGGGAVISAHKNLFDQLKNSQTVQVAA